MWSLVKTLKQLAISSVLGKLSGTIILFVKFLCRLSRHDTSAYETVEVPLEPGTVQFFLSIKDLLFKDDHYHFTVPDPTDLGKARSHGFFKY